MAYDLLEFQSARLIIKSSSANKQNQEKKSTANKLNYIYYKNHDKTLIILSEKS